MSVPPDKLVLLRIAVRQGGLDKRPGQETHLAGRESVLLVEEKRLPDQARRSSAWALNSCRMKL
jgi:hypothetical protein